MPVDAQFNKCLTNILHSAYLFYGRSRLRVTCSERIAETQRREDTGKNRRQMKCGATVFLPVVVGVFTKMSTQVSDNGLCVQQRSV
jgi:hypothetical protein